MRELTALEPESESRATCATCVLSAVHTGAERDRPWLFHPDLHCCTFHPNQSNFLVGQALERGGTSEAVILRRLKNPSGVEAIGINAPEAYSARYAATAHVAFGRDRALACPYWVKGELGCGIWRDRGSVCRTWFCKHDQGRRGRQWWSNTKAVLHIAEYLIATFCMKQGEPPEEGAPVQAWVAWYRWCAERVRAMTDEETETLRVRDLTRRLDELLDRPELPPIPEIVIPAVSMAEHRAGAVWLAGWSMYDVMRGPFSIFLFFSKLDGHTPWRQALAETNAEAEEPVTEALVLDLYRVGGVRSPEPGDLPGEEDLNPGIVRLGPETWVRFFTE